jgi:hypothetical protein
MSKRLTYVGFGRCEIIDTDSDLINAINRPQRQFNELNVGVFSNEME